jgi:hypothetical protein
MIRPVVHLLLHFIVPGIVARFSFRDRWIRAWLIMSLTIIVDLDHLLADPIYDPHRCSIAYHPLHSYPVMVFYLALALLPHTRLVGLGLLIHMALDGIDCIWMKGW